MRPGEHNPRRRGARDGRLAAGSSRGSVGPLYERLPHGPHQLDRKEVARNQRARIHGAMIEAVSRHGYEQASVKHVITLAGVSRRSFYEQFSNKRECFLATFDLLAARELRRVRSAYIAAPGGLDARVRAIVGAQLEGAQEEPKSTHLLLVDSLAVGEAGLTRCVRAAAAHERLLGECFQGAARGSAPSAPLLRALTGGMHGVIGAQLGTGMQPSQSLQEPLVEWALAVHAPAGRDAVPWLAERLRERMRAVALDLATAARAQASAGRGPGARAEIAPDHGRGPRTPAAAGGGPGARAEAGEERIKLLDAALRLAARHGHGELTAPQIADAAELPIEAVLSRFATPEACTAAVHEMVAEQLCAAAAEARADSPDWPRSVRPLVAALLAHLAAHPLHALALVQGSWCLGPHTVAASSDLTVRLAALLSPDTGQRVRQPPLTGEVAAHALWHTLRCLIASRRVQLLPALTDHFSFLLLAPALGARPALALLRSDP